MARGLGLGLYRGLQFRVVRLIGLESGSESELGLKPQFSVAGGRVHSIRRAQGKSTERACTSTGYSIAAQVRRVCTVTIVRTGVASEVGAQSAPVGRKRGARACKVTGDWGPSCEIGGHRRSWWAGVSQCRESAARPRSRPGGPVRRLGDEAVGSAARGAAQVSLWPGGGEASRAPGPARLMGPAHTRVVVTASVNVIGPSQLTQLARCSPQLARCSLCGGQTANEYRTSNRR